MTSDPTEASREIMHMNELLLRARSHVMTPAERFEQRVSFIYGGMSSRSTATKDQIRKWLTEGFGGH